MKPSNPPVVIAPACAPVIVAVDPNFKFIDLTRRLQRGGLMLGTDRRGNVWLTVRTKGGAS
jgi:hypothetical protein